MQRASSKSQLGNGIQISVSNSPTINMPLSLNEYKISSTQSRQRKPSSTHSFYTTKQNNLNTSPSLSTKQSQVIQQHSCDQYQDQNKSLLYTNGMFLGNNQSYTDCNNYLRSAQKNINQIQGQSIVSSLQQVGQKRHIPNTYNSNDSCYIGNKVQIGTVLSPQSSTNTSSNILMNFSSNIQMNNLLLTSQNSNGQSNQNFKVQNSIQQQNITSPQNYNTQRQNISPIRIQQIQTYPKLTSFEKSINNKQLQQINKTYNSLDHRQLENCDLLKNNQLNSSGNEIYQTEDSLELNAMKIIGEQKKLQEMTNKKDAIDKLLFAAKDLIPQLSNTLKSMEKKEVDIFKFIETQERNIDNSFNRLIYELNLFRQNKLNQLQTCRYDIKQKYSIASSLCNRNLEELNKLHDDILSHYNSIILELEEQKVTMIIQNYFQRWNQAFIFHENIMKQQQLDIFQVDQTCLSQIQDQLNFLCNLTLQKIQTTFVKQNDNSPCSSPLSKNNSSMSIENRVHSNPCKQRSLQSSKSTVSINQSKEKKIYNLPFNPSVQTTSKILKQFSQKQKYKSNKLSSELNSSIHQNNLSNIILQEDINNNSLIQDVNKSLIQSQATQQQHINLRQLPSQLQEIKKKLIQNQIKPLNKPFYISFDNKEAFRPNQDIGNKENIQYINGIQTIYNNALRIQGSHHQKSQSHPHLICIDLKDVQNHILQKDDKHLKNQINLTDNQIKEEIESIPLDDCDTFRNRVTYQIENDMQSDENQGKQISTIKDEKKLQQNDVNQFSEQRSQSQTEDRNRQNLPLQDISSKTLNVYESIQKQNTNKRSEHEQETRIQGQTPNFSNKKKGVVTSPYNKSDNNRVIENDYLKKYDYRNSEERKMDEIFEKERKSRDNSINKKKQFNEMIKVVQHNQIQRNMNCETILKKVSENHIDSSSYISINSTPSHFRSNSAQVTNFSGKNSINSSHNKPFQRSDEQQMSDKFSKAIKKYSFDEIFQSRNTNTVQEIGEIMQKLSFEKSQSNQQQDIKNQELIEYEGMNLDSIKQVVENTTYDQQIQNKNQFNSIPNTLQNIDNNLNKILAIQNINPIILEDNEQIINPIKTTQNSEQKIVNNNLLNDIQKTIYLPFSQMIDY